MEKMGFVVDSARMWPREVFDHVAENQTGRHQVISKHDALKILKEPGVYVLYRDEVPYYVGQANKLLSRLTLHATHPGGRYDGFWNYFSVFVVPEKVNRNHLEAILIAALPTANSAKPKLKRTRYPKVVVNMMRKIRRNKANPD